MITSKRFYQISTEVLFCDNPLHIRIRCCDRLQGIAVVGVSPGGLVKSMAASPRVKRTAALANKVTLMHEDVFSVAYGDEISHELLPDPITWPAISYADLAEWLSQHVAPTSFHLESFAGRDDLSKEILDRLPVGRIQSATFKCILGVGGPTAAFVAFLFRAAPTMKSINISKSKAVNIEGIVPFFPQLEELTLSPNIGIPLDTICTMIERAPRLQRVMWGTDEMMAPIGKTATQRRVEALCGERGVNIGQV